MIIIKFPTFKVLIFAITVFKAVRLRFAKDVAITLLVSLSMLGIWATTRLLAATEHVHNTIQPRNKL